MKRMTLQTQYFLQQSKWMKTTAFLLLSLVGLQCANWLLFRGLSLNNTPWPWGFIAVLQAGFVMPVIVTFIAMAIPIVAIIFYITGGLRRAIARLLLLYWSLLLGLTSLAVYGYSLWQGIDMSPYPWLVYSLFLESTAGSESYNHLLISLFSSYSLLFIILAMKAFSVKTKAEKVFGQAHFASAFDIEKAGLFTDTGIVLGQAYGQTLRLSGFEGVLVVAPTGGGKTAAIAVPNLLEWQGSGVFNDLKGELYRLTARHRNVALKNRCFVWAPADTTKQSACYNPFYYVSHHPELRIRDLQLLAETLIPATHAGTAFWYQSSRELFLTLALYLFETTDNATLSELHDLSKQEDFFEWLDNVVTENETLSVPLKQNVFAILGADDKTKRNILKDFHAHIGLFGDPIVAYATNRNDFDFRELRRKKISIYIYISDSDKERLSPLLTLFWAQLINAMSSHEPTSDEAYGVLALLDEFGNMARINKLKDGMSFLRSYHMRCIVIVQYLSQIVSVYGQYDAKGFLNSKVKIAFALNDIDDAQFFSKSLGTKTVKVTSSSTSSGHGDSSGSCSHTVNYQGRSLMTPDEIMMLPEKKAIILMESKNPILASKMYWFKKFEYTHLMRVTVNNQLSSS